MRLPVKVAGSRMVEARDVAGALSEVLFRYELKGNITFINSWYGVVSFAAPGIAPDQPLDAQPGPPNQSVPLNGFLGVMGAGWIVAARRRQVRGEHLLVKLDQ